MKRNYLCRWKKGEIKDKKWQNMKKRNKMNENRSDEKGRKIMKDS